MSLPTILDTMNRNAEDVIIVEQAAPQTKTRTVLTAEEIVTIRLRHGGRQTAR